MKSSIMVVFFSRNKKGGAPIISYRRSEFAPPKIGFLADDYRGQLPEEEKWGVAEIFELDGKNFCLYRPVEIRLDFLQDKNLPFYLRLNPELGNLPAFVVGYGGEAQSVLYAGEWDDRLCPFSSPSFGGEKKKDLYTIEGITVGDMLPLFREMGEKGSKVYFFTRGESLYVLQLFHFTGECHTISKFGDWKYLLEVEEKYNPLFTPAAKKVWDNLRTEHIQSAEQGKKAAEAQERTAKLRRVALTGTFNIKRDELEQKLREAGHEVADLSSSTQVLLVGEKTASSSKIQKAREKFRIWILEATDSDAILEQLATRTPSGYISSYDRNFDSDEGEEGSIEVGVAQVFDVYGDFTDRQADAGEWFDADAIDYLDTMLNPMSMSEFFDNLWDYVGVRVTEAEKQEFVIAFFRLCFLDAILEPGVWEDISVANLMSPKFYEKFQFLSFITLCDDFEIEDLKKEILEDDEKKSLIQKAKEGESKLV